MWASGEKETAPLAEGGLRDSQLLDNIFFQYPIVILPFSANLGSSESYFFIKKSILLL